MGREIKRVALDFAWPLGEVWGGYLEPKQYDEAPCPANCDAGYSPRAKELGDLWYGYVPFDPASTGSERLTATTPEVRAFAERNVANSPGYYGTGEPAIHREARRLANHWNGQWSHHLTQDDVDALVKGGRLMDFTHTWSRETGWLPKDPPATVTAAQVNRWSLGGFGHDAINRGIVIRARCEREGVSDTCEGCGGHGSIEAYAGQREERDAWEHVEPPAGDGWQVWETVSEGSPITPVFATAEALVDYLATKGTLWDQRERGDGPWRREAAEAFVKVGSAPSMITTGGQVFMGGRDADKIDEALRG